jgi:hypothetical protein
LNTIQIKDHCQYNRWCFHFLLFDVDEANAHRIGEVVDIESAWRGNNPVKGG